MKNIKTILFVCFIFVLGAQNIGYAQGKYELHLKDHHSTQISDILYSKEEKKIITIDNSGKILKYNTDDYSYDSTVKKSDNFSIETPRLISDNKGILFKSKDSLWVLDIKGKILGKNLFKGNIVSNKKSPFVIFTEKKGTSFLVSIYNDKLQLYKSFKTNTNIQVATVNKDSTHIAYVEQDDFYSKQKLIYRDLKQDLVLWSSEVEEENKIVYPFFYELDNALYTITCNKNKNILSVFSYEDGKRKVSSEVNTPWFPLVLTTSIIDGFLDEKKIVITDKSNSPEGPVILSLENNKFTLNKVKIKEGAYSGDFLNDAKLVTSNGFNDNIKSIANFTVSNIKERKTISSHPNFAQKFYEGSFLPDDSFLIQDRANELQVKYFSKGTFHNRFNTLSFKDYLEINHKVIFYTNSCFFDKNKDLILFRGADLVTKQRFIFKYDFIKDKLTKLYKPEKKYWSIIDFDATSNKLLLSPKKYYNTGFIKPQPLALIENNKIIKEFTGLFKFARFSEGAKHILTINDKNLVQIRENVAVIKLEEQLPKSAYLLRRAEYGFIVSYTAYSKEKRMLIDESIFFMPNDDDAFKPEKKPFIYIDELDYKNNKVALVIKNLGIVIGDKILPKDNFESVKSVSFNKDASKLMISYANGKINIINTETLKEVGGMFHLSEKDHVFYDTNNHYFSNTSADDFLFATKDNKKIALKDAGQSIFKPSEVLNVFGKPNQEYLTLLKKANTFRENNTDFNEGKPNIAQKVTNKKGDLYVLSFGVSKYEQEAYNLTFADKDAFDIANLYGKLDSITIKEFNDNFLGNKYTLQNSDNNDSYSINKYLGKYASIGKMYPINLDSKIWIEINGDKNFIWNFNKQEVRSIALPKDFQIDKYGMEQVFTSPIKDECYVWSSNNKLYRVNFKSKQPEEIMLPFKIELSGDFKNIRPLKNGNWLRCVSATNKNEVYTVIANEKTHKLDTITYSFDKYKFSDKINSVEKWNNLRPKFKSLSLNGNYLLVSAFGGELYSEDLYLQKLSKNELPIKIPIKINYSDKVSISEDGKKITVLSSKIREFRYKTTIYDLDGTILDTKTYIDEEYNIKGMSIINSDPKFIESSASLVSDFNYGDLSNNKILSESLPFSFNKTFVKKLSNKEATKENIEAEITGFLKEVKKEDQVIVFIAGHGVLDEKNNYYYAPHNMDFNDITKNGVAFKTIINGLSNTKAANKLLLMDTCHAGNTLDIIEADENHTVIEKGQRGSIGNSSRKTPKFKMSDIIGTLFDDFMSKSGITILSASSGADVAFENKELSNGAFTSAYLKVLKSKMDVSLGVINKEDVKKSVIVTKEFISEVLKEVIKLTNGKQVPDVREFNKNGIIKAW